MPNFVRLHTLHLPTQGDVLPTKAGPASNSPIYSCNYGRGAGVGRGLGVGANLGVGDGLAVAVGVGETVPVAVAVGVALIVTVADGDAVGVGPLHIACGDTVIV